MIRYGFPTCTKRHYPNLISNLAPHLNHFDPELNMEYKAGGPILKVLLLIGGQPSRTGPRKEQLHFLDGRLAIGHALDTLHSAVASATTIYISLHDETHMQDIEASLKGIIARAEDAEHDEHDHHHSFPELKLILAPHEKDIGHAAGLLTAHSIHTDAKWLVLSCDFPHLPPSALQQLILEYQDPITCFVNEKGVAEPSIGIWGAEGLEKLKENVENGRFGLDGVVEEMKGRLIKPLRERWITRTNTREEWDDAMEILA
jgi:molybdopterin-guanine dinucleotide biosynthesis protein A